MPNKTTSSITTDNNNNNKKNDTTSSAESIKNAIASFKQNPYYSPLYDCDVNYFRYKFSPDSLTIKSAVAIKSIDIKPLKKDESTTTTTTTTKVAEPLKVVNNSTKLTQTKTTTTIPNNPIAKSKSMITKAQTETTTTNISLTSKDDNPKSSSSSSSNKSSTAAAALKKSKSIIALNKKDGNDSKFKKSVKFKNEDSVKVIKPVATLLEPANTAKSKPIVAAVAAAVATKPTTTPIVTNQQIIKTPSTTNTTTTNTTNTVKAQPVKPNTTTINNKTVSNKLIQTKQQETSKSLNNISKQVVFVSPNLDSSIKSSTTTASTPNAKPITTTSKSTDQIKSIANKVTTTPTKPIEQPVIVKPNAVKPTVTTNTESIKAATATTTTKINNVIDKPVIVSATTNIEANKTPIKNVTILAAQLKVEPIQPVTPIIATTNNKNKVTNNNKATKATSVIVSPQPQSSITLIKPKTLSLKNSSPISNPTTTTTTTTTTCKKKLNNTFSKSFNHTNHLLINDYENLFDFNSSEVERSKSPDLNYRLSNLNQEMKLLQRNNTNTPNKESSAPPIITNQIVSINRKPSPVLKSVTFSNLNDHNNLDLTPIIKSPILPQPQLALPKSASFKIIEENKNINQQALIDQSIEAASVALLAASMSNNNNNNNNNTQSSSVYLTTPPPITPSLILTSPPISPSLVTTPTPTSTPTNLTIDTIDTITTISNNNNNNEYLSDLEPSDTIYNVTKPESPSEQPILSPEINKQEEDEDEKTIISTSPLIGDQIQKEEKEEEQQQQMMMMVQEQLTGFN